MSPTPSPGGSRQAHTSTDTPDRTDGDDDLDGALRAAVEAWNPLAAAEAGLDEYADLVGPLRLALLGGASRAELSLVLWDHLEDCWGVEPWRCGVDRFVDRLVTWRENWPT